MFKQDADLAIIIPYFKKSFFEDTLLSLKNQTDSRFNIYIGDDCSAENPKNLIEFYGSKLNINYFRFSKNLGSQSLVKQWERCIKLSNNEKWILILGDDDVLGLNVVEHFYKLQDNFIESSVVRFATKKVDSTGKVISEIYKYQTWESSINILFNKKRSSLSEYIFQKQKIQSVGFQDFPMGWFSDIFAILECSNFSNIYTINKAIVYIRYSSQNISSKSDKTSMRLKFKSAYLFYHKILKNYSNNFSNDQISVLLNRISRTYINDKFRIERFIVISYYFFYFFHFKHYVQFIVDIQMSLKNRS